MKYKWHLMEARLISSSHDIEDIQNYIEDMTDEGWEFVTSDSGVLYFRKEKS